MCKVCFCALTGEAGFFLFFFFLWVLMVKWLLVRWGFSGFSGFLMVLMVWNVIPGRQSIRGGSDNDLPPSSPVCECKRERQREKLCVSICTVNVCVCVCVCVCNDVDGQNIVQTDNESCESTITGHYRKPNPILPISPLFGLHFLHIYVQSIFIFRSMYVH